MRWFKRLKTRKRSSRRGVLTLEWVLIVTVLVIGIIGGIGAVRNAVILELADLAEAIKSLNVAPAGNNATNEDDLWNRDGPWDDYPH